MNFVSSANLPSYFRGDPGNRLLIYLPATGARTTRRKGEEGTLTFAYYSGSDYFLELKILNFATEEPGKVQVRELVRAWGVLSPLLHGGRY